uniref:AAA+ ATPase domain-containing protein n=1 Tax=Calcidiscus leptoporus TaxID=127549 RepID=A0A7S0IXE7_9EUKA
MSSAAARDSEGVRGDSAQPGKMRSGSGRRRMNELLSRMNELVSRAQQVLARVEAALPAWLTKFVSRYRFALMAFIGTIIFARAQVLLGMRSPAPRIAELSYAAFLNMVSVEPARVSALRISLSRYSFLLDGEPAFTRPVRAPMDVLNMLHRSGIDFRAAATSGAAGLVPLLFPVLWLAAIYSVLRRQLTGATGSVGKRATARKLSADDLSFDDVAGVDSAKEEVQEVVSMLRQPERYAAAGARVPAGVLMVGPPGTGKTLLARVMAAQAQVPFFYCSGSDFVELFIGRGAARMRALFKEAAAVAPCVIFIDELDALGKQRTLRLGGQNDEVEQTLNQMLACMDGVDSSNNGVVVMGATNRYEILDPALTRPGRFDRLVRMELPDDAGRLAILRVHTRKLALADDVQLARIASTAPGFSGAELAALANEAAIRSVRRQGGEVVMDDFVGALIDFTSSRRRGIGGFVSKIVGS